MFKRKVKIIASIFLACIMMISVCSISVFARGESASDPVTYQTRGVETYVERSDDEKHTTAYYIDYLNKTVYIVSTDRAIGSDNPVSSEPLYDDGNDNAHFNLTNGKTVYIKYLSHKLY